MSKVTDTFRAAEPWISAANMGVAVFFFADSFWYAGADKLARLGVALACLALSREKK